MKRIAAILLIALLLSFSAPPALAEDAGTDLLLIVTHPGDEYLYFGGILPTYSGEYGYSTAVIYLTSADETQRQQAEAGLTAHGVATPPVFGPFPDVYADSLENAKKYWKEADVVRFLQEQIELLRPAVIVTHDAGGEYGNGMHRLTAACALSAVKKASASWQVQRLYRHLAPDDPVVIDRTEPLTRYRGLTALETDRLGYEAYSEAYRYPLAIADSGYTAASYGVVYTASGDLTQPDNDLFAGVDRAMLTGPNYAMPEETPTATPTLAPTPAPDPETPAVTAPPAQEAADAPEPERPFPVLFLMLSILSAIAGLAVIIRSLTHRRSRLLRLLSAVLLLLAAALLLFGFRQKKAGSLLQAVSTTPAPTGTPTASPLPAVTPLPAPTVTATPEPTPTPHPWAAYFRADGEAEEVIVADTEREHWEYRTDTLSILIDRYHVLNADGRPIAYCVAHIRQKNNVSAFRAGMRDKGSVSSRGLEQPWHMARRMQAVLAVTGDNMTQAETNIKGILMRDGKVYSAKQAADTLALYPDLSLRIFAPGETTPEALLADGVENTFSFGPTLIRDGVVNTGGTRTKLGAINPRCGIGMVEPGHFIVITVDGRQRDYSQGISIGAFMHLFYTHGCVQAYNLDGGSSTAMVFMGEHLNRHSHTNSDFQRGWPDAILFGYSEQVPAVDDPISNKGYGEGED